MIDKLIEFASELGFEDLKARLLSISETMHDSMAPLVLPLVGEFSAGKTTLINALSNSKALESASEPTTATIYVLHFGSDRSYARVHYEDGTITETDSIAELDNKKLIDTKVVEVFDTSTKIPASVMMVDTPGLSSHDIKHRQNLVDFLPQADGVILVVDIQQPVTRSLTDFAKTIELSNRPLYMVITQCDTKSEKDIESQKRYILNNTELHLNGIACVSAKTDNLDEFYRLIEDIQSDKTHIQSSVNEYRCKEIAKQMVERIETILKTDESDEAIEDEIRGQQLKLNKLRRDLDNLVKDIESDIESERRNVSRRFEDTVFNRLESIVTGTSDNFDAEAISAINNTSSLLLNDFKSNIIKIFKEHSDKCEGISSIDLSGLNLDGMAGCYNINLNEAGHEYDAGIGTALKVVAVAGAVIATAGVASAAAGGAAAAGAAGGVAAGGAGAGSAAVAQGVLVAADVVDTVTDVASIASNRRTVDRIGKVVEASKLYGTQMSDKMGKLNEFDAQAGQRMGQKKGIVASMVGFVTERTMGRPQRRRVINDYINNTLAPLFSSELTRMGNEIIAKTEQTILSSSQEEVNTVSQALESLKKDRECKRQEYEARIIMLKSIRKELLKL